MQDDSVAALISHATEERLKYLIEEIRSKSHQRESLMISVGSENFVLLIESLLELDDGKRRKRKQTCSRRR